jgi:hypothetical protein
MSLYDGNDELELERLNAGPSFDLVDVPSLEELEKELDEESVEEENVVAEEEKDNVVEEIRDSRYRDHLPLKDEETGYIRYDPSYGYSPGGELSPVLEGHHWIEQDDGSWWCKTCGEIKQKTVKSQKVPFENPFSKKKNRFSGKTDYFKAVDEEDVRVFALERKEKTRGENTEVVTNKNVEREGEGNDSPKKEKAPLEEALPPLEETVEGVQIKWDNPDDDTLYNDGKLKVDTKLIKGKDFKGFVTQEHSQQVGCDWKYIKKEDDDEDFENRPCKELAFYANSDGKNYCSKHVFAMGDQIQNAEKIVYSTYADISRDVDGQNSITRSSFSTLDKEILDKQGRPNALFFPVKIVKKYFMCDETSEDEPCGLAIYSLFYRDGSRQNLCGKHTKKIVKNKDEWNKVQRIIKLVCPKVPSTTGRVLEEEGTDGNVKKDKDEVVIPENLLEQNGDQMIDTRKELIESGYGQNEGNHLEESYFLYLCSDSVAKRKARFKIYNPATNYTYYFNVPIATDELSSGVFFDRDVVDIPMAKKIYANFIGKDTDSKADIANRFDITDLILSCDESISVNSNNPKKGNSKANRIAGELDFVDEYKEKLNETKPWRKWKGFISKDWWWNPETSQAERVDNVMNDDVEDDDVEEVERHRRRETKVKVKKRKTVIKKHLFRKNIAT